MGQRDLRGLVIHTPRGAVAWTLRVKYAGTLRVWYAGTLRVWSAGTLRVWYAGTLRVKYATTNLLRELRRYGRQAVVAAGVCRYLCEYLFLAACMKNRRAAGYDVTASKLLQMSLQIHRTDQRWRSEAKGAGETPV